MSDKWKKILDYTLIFLVFAVLLGIFYRIFIFEKESQKVPCSETIAEIKSELDMQYDELRILRADLKSQQNKIKVLQSQITQINQDQLF